MIEYYEDTADMMGGIETEFSEEDPSKVIKSTNIWDGEDTIAEWNNRIGSWRYGNQVETIGPLLFDQMFQSRFLRDDIEMRVTMQLAPPELALFTTTPDRKFQLELMESRLIIPR